MNKITRITLAVPQVRVARVLLMAESLRTFGCNLKNSPITMLTPAAGDRFSDHAREKLAALAVEIMPFEADATALQFPFAAKIFAAAAAEKKITGQSEDLFDDGGWQDLSIAETLKSWSDIRLQGQNSAEAQA